MQVVYPNACICYSAAFVNRSDMEWCDTFIEVEDVLIMRDAAVSSSVDFYVDVDWCGGCWWYSGKSYLW